LELLEIRGVEGSSQDSGNGCAINREPEKGGRVEKLHMKIDELTVAAQPDDRTFPNLKSGGRARF